MDVRVTPISISRFVASKKCKAGTPAIYLQNRFSSLNTRRNTGQGGANQNVLLTRRNRLNKPQTLNASKRLDANNNLLLVSKKGTSKPRVFLKITPGIEQAAIAAGNKKILLYQQIDKE